METRTDSTSSHVARTRARDATAVARRSAFARDDGVDDARAMRRHGLTTSTRTRTRTRTNAIFVENGRFVVENGRLVVEHGRFVVEHGRFVVTQMDV